jgi:GntR family transcriptional regulator
MTTEMTRLDAAGDDLLFERVRRRIAADVAAGRLKRGERLAPERELAKRLGVSRNTLRRALHTLAEQALLESAGRRGWRVAERSFTETAHGPQSMTQWAAANGLELRSRVRRARVRAATDLEAQALRIARGAPVFELERVRIINGLPLSLDRSVLVLELAPFLPEVEFAKASLYGVLLDRAGIAPGSHECTIRAAAASARVAKVLDIAVGSPVLVMDELVADQSGRPFELARLTNRGDAYGYRTMQSAPVLEELAGGHGAS